MNRQDECEIAKDFKTKTLLQLLYEKPDGDEGYDSSIVHEIAHDVPSCPVRRNPHTGKFPKTIWEHLGMLQSNDTRKEFLANYNHRVKTKIHSKVVPIQPRQHQLTSA